MTKVVGVSTVGVIARVEEQLDVRKRTIETGALRVRKVSHDEVVAVPVQTRATQAMVERVAVGMPVDAQYPARRDGDTVIVPVFEYRPVVVQRLFLKEEIRITQQIVESSHVEQVTLQRDEIVVERREGESGSWHPSQT